MEELVKELKEHIIEALNLDDMTPDDIDAAAPLFGTGLGLDSIDALELVVMVEKYYQIRIVDSEIGNKVFASVNSLAEFIKSKQENG